MNKAFKKLPSEVRNWIGRHLFENVPNNIAVIDRDFKVVTANGSFKSVFGDPDGKHCYEVYKSRNKKCEQCMAARTFEDGKVRVNDEEGIDKDGRPAHYVVHTAPVYDEIGDVAYVIEMSYDLTETKSLQREYNILFERVPCYVSVINKDLRIVRANRLLRDTFGDMVGEHCYEVYKQRSEKCPDCPALKTFFDGGSHSSEHIGIDKRGNQTQYVVSTSPLARSGDEFSHVIETAVDITEKLENERLAAVGQTVAQLSHGIKNILTGLRGGMYAIKSGAKSGSEERTTKGWTMLERNVDRMTVLVKGFLNYSKRRTLNVKFTSPVALAREVFALYEAAAKKDNVTLLLEAKEDIAAADMEPSGIHTCLANLVSNALDACQLSQRDECKVVIRVTDENGVIVFEVEDHGCGMEPEVKDKVFRSFFTTKGLKGTGLGLLVTRKTVEEHGGSISVVSEPGKGSIFRMEFPRTRLPRVK
ncbi:MAG: PAS domain-containing protein [Deltaproteobacteria bacterium]|nr:PAS domain-containing protein [Deltaproteobacteria bacterium]